VNKSAISLPQVWLLGVAVIMLSKLKSRKVAILAFTGTLIPIAGLHKFYRTAAVGLVYVLLSWTPIPHVASAIEGVWYLSQEERI